MNTKKREFIDPNDLMRYINEKHCYSGLPMAAHICTMELLTYAPRVDAEEVVHGRWYAKPVRKLNGKGRVVDYCDCYYCSECGIDRPIVPPYNYCPNCGAKMDGERRTNEN